MGVIKGRSRAAVTAPNEDGTTPETLGELALLDGGVTTDDGLSEVEADTGITMNDGTQSGRIRLLPSRRSQLRRNYRNRHPAIPVNTAPPPKVSSHGSKKFRRYENQLELLKECDENEHEEVSIEDFINGANSARAFSKILQQSSMLELWNKYIDESEALNHEREQKRNRVPGRSRSQNVEDEFNPDEAFQGICRKLRGLIKQRHFPLGMMEAFEEDLIAFFSTRPEDTFESDPLDAFRRSMIHALSQYNNLRSHSVKCKENVKENAKKVRVVPSEQPFSPPPVRLVHYLETRYHNPRSDVT